MDDRQLSTLFCRQFAGKSTLNSSFGHSAAMPLMDEHRVASSKTKFSKRINQLAEGKNVTQSQLDELENFAADVISGIVREPQTPLRIDRVITAEAVIETDGSRPVIDVGADGLVLNQVDLGDWNSVVSGFRSEIEKTALSVGRIDADHLGSSFAGTGFAIGENLIMTNHHVLKQKIGLVQGDGSWKIRPNSYIDFGMTLGAQEESQRRFYFTEVIYPGNGEIDICIMRCEENNNSQFPEALPFIGNVSSLTEGREIYTVGFPARPRRFFSEAPPTDGHETIEIIRELFRDTFGFKRISIGEIMQPPGFLSDESKASIFSHDASTLAGSSGSCIVDLATFGDRGVGIHFGGASREENQGHALSTLQSVLQSHGINFV